MSLTYGFSLQPTDSSADFSDAFHAATGDGVTEYGGRFSLTINGFMATLSSGYALAAGRWLKNEESLTMRLPMSDNNDDRTDAIAVRVDYVAKKAALEILRGVDPEAIKANPGLLRNDGQYVLVLYLIKVRRGVTSLTPNDVTDLRDNPDLCGRVLPYSAVADDVLWVYRFLTDGINAEADRLIGLSNAVIAKANAAIIRLEAEIRDAGGVPEIGELTTSIQPPAPSVEWLLCDGSAVPAAYTVLSALLEGTLPEIPAMNEKFKTYIYGGTPVEV